MFAQTFIISTVPSGDDTTCLVIEFDEGMRPEIPMPSQTQLERLKSIHPLIDPENYLHFDIVDEYIQFKCMLGCPAPVKCTAQIEFAEQEERGADPAVTIGYEMDDIVCCPLANTQKMIYVERLCECGDSFYVQEKKTFFADAL